MTTTCYAASVSKDEVGTTEAAAELGVSVDTIHAMIRDELLPARQDRPGGPFAIARADLDKVRAERGPRGTAGPSTLTDADLARARAAQSLYLAAEEERKRAKRHRDQVIGEIADKAKGHGAIGDLAHAMGVHRVTVQDLKTRYRRGAP